jgi:hypothetical protein
VKCGDSLVGVFDLKLLENGIPDDAYKATQDDDTKTPRDSTRSATGESARAGNACSRPSTSNRRSPPSTRRQWRLRRAGKAWAPGAQNSGQEGVFGISELRKIITFPHLSSHYPLPGCVQFPPPPPNSLGNSGLFPKTPNGVRLGVRFFRQCCLSQSLWASSDKRPEEVLANVPAVALLDHWHRCSAVFSKPFKLAPSESAHAMNVCRVI